MSDIEQEEWLEAQRLRVVNEYVERDRKLFHAQKNPLYAWNAISHLLARDLPLPEWCLNYLKCCAFRIDNLAKEVVGTDWEADLDSSARKKPNNMREPNSATSAMMSALDFHFAQGSSPFAALRSDVAHMQDEAHLEFSSDPTKAKEEISVRRNVSLERGVSHRTQKGRRLLYPNDST